MRKEQAAKFLGIGVRTLEEYASQGRISVTYERGKTRPTANYDEVELKAFKEVLKNPTIKPAFESRGISQADADYQGIVTHEGSTTFSEIQLLEKLAGIIEFLLNAKPAVAIAHKLLLTITEAQKLTGLSRKTLRTAIANNQLNAVVIGRAFRINRTDLEDYVNHLTKPKLKPEVGILNGARSGNKIPIIGKMT